MLKENTIQNQTTEDYKNVLDSIFNTVHNVDIISKKSCTQLDHFVFLSSLSCGRGNSGQENYGMAYSMLERLCEKRHQESLPALAIQFGPIEDESGAVSSLVSLETF